MMMNVFPRILLTLARNSSQFFPLYRRRGNPQTVVPTLSHRQPTPAARPAPKPENEAERLKALYRYQILDTPPEEAFDDLTALASSICGTPIALVSLVDAHRQWFKSKVGLDATETHRDLAFCAHAILTTDEPLIVPNALDDERFARNPLVLSDPNIRFYAGVALVTPNNFPLGTLCVIDRIPRQLTTQQIEALRALGRQVVSQLELRINLARLEQTVTKHKQAKEALRQSEQQYRSVVNSVKEVIFQIDATGFWTFLNPAWTEITGFTVPDSLGTNSWDYVHPDDRHSNWEQFKPLIERQINYCRHEVRYVTKDGGFCWMEVFAQLTLNEDGAIIGISGTLNDITQRKQADEELRKTLEKEKELNELKTRFISMSSHEFRTPLTTILGSSELLKYYSHNWNEEKKLVHFDRIHSSVQHMTQLLDDVLLVGKIEAGKLEIKLSSIDLVKFCQNLVDDLQLIANTTHTLRFTHPNSCPEAYVDEKLLRQILSNLLSNAIKYSPKGSTVTLKLTVQDGEVIFQIQDQGIGIPQDEQQHLFESFYRATNVGKIPGTGLGLAIVKKSVDLHGGKITVNSELDLGTTFTVSIPLKFRTLKDS